MGTWYTEVRTLLGGWNQASFVSDEMPAERTLSGGQREFKFTPVLIPVEGDGDIWGLEEMAAYTAELHAQQEEEARIKKEAAEDEMAAKVESRLAMDYSEYALHKHAQDRQVTVKYTNYNGVTEVRRITPMGLRYGCNKWHPESQWLLDVYDWDREGFREYALDKCIFDMESKNEV